VLSYFDPLSVEDMADAIERVLEDRSLRDQLARQGLQRASSFSWERCARETLELLVRTHEEIVG
jgi:glycosyltransferase involved in cell wall biosynthesis